MSDLPEIITYSGAPPEGMIYRAAGTYGNAGVMAHFKRMRSMGGTRPGKPYSTVTTLHACVNARAEALASMPLVVSTGDETIVENGPAAELCIRPNAQMTMRQFLMETSAYLDLFGRCHWVMLPGLGGLPTAVVPVNPLQMRAVKNASGELVAWKFRAAGDLRGREETIELDDVHTIINTDYEDPQRRYDGLAPTHAAMMAISQHWKADLANESSLDNGVEPGGALVTEHDLTDGQISGLKDQMHERNQGVRNRRVPLVLSGGLTWQQMAASFADMEFSILKKMSRTEICASLKVPPPVVGYFEDSNYAHAEAANEDFWLRTVIPLGVRIAEEWTYGVLQRFNKDRSLRNADATTAVMNRRGLTCLAFKEARRAARGLSIRYYAWFDSSGIPSVQSMQLKMMQSIRHMLESGVATINEVITVYDLPFVAKKWGNTWHKDIGKVDVLEDSAPGSEDLPAPTPDDDYTPGSEEDKPEGKAVEVVRVATASGGSGASGASGGKSESRRAKLHDMWRASWAGLKRATEKAVKRHFYNLRKETLQNLKVVEGELPTITASFKAAGKIERRDILGRILFDVVKADEALVVKVGKFIQEAYRLGGEQSMREAADAKGQEKPDPFRIGDPWVKEKMLARKSRIKGANKTTKNRVSRTLAQGLENGEGYAQLAERVRAVFKDAEGPRAGTIARTEVGAAVEEARQAGRDQAGVPMKSWLHSRKEKGRPSHKATEQQTMEHPIANDAQFVIAGTGVRCDFPRSSGEAEHDINCGCTTLARHKGDNIKDVEARYMRRGYLTYEQLMTRDAAGDER